MANLGATGSSAGVAVVARGASGWAVSLSAFDWKILAAFAADPVGGDTSCELGNLHLPSESCGQTTIGLISETSLMTNRWKKATENEYAAEMCAGLS